jgi:hypothetical protein
MSILPGGADVGGQPRTGKSRVREFTLSLGAFNLRMQALRRLLPIDFREHHTHRHEFPSVSAHRYW